jgi:ABC-2 type transport system permease protein
MYLFSQKLTTTNGKDTLNFMFLLQLSSSLGILIGVFAVDMVCREFTSGYIKNLIACGHKRRDIYLAKSITAFIGICVFTFIGPIIIMLVNTYKNGFGEVFTISSFLFIARAFLYSFIAHAAIASMAVVISYTVKNIITGSVIIVAIDFINRLFNVAYTQRPDLRAMLDMYPYMQLYAIFTDKITRIQSMKLLIVFSCTVLISTVLGIYIFKKSDI